jgi:hypothetical protein
VPSLLTVFRKNVKPKNPRGKLIRKTHEENSSGKTTRKTHQEKTKKIREREKKEYAI